MLSIKSGSSKNGDMPGKSYNGKCECCKRTFVLTTEFLSINEGNCRNCKRKVCTFCVKKKFGFCRRCEIVCKSRLPLQDFNLLTEKEINKLLYGYGVDIKVSRVTGKQLCIYLLSLFYGAKKDNSVPNTLAETKPLEVPVMDTGSQVRRDSKPTSTIHKRVTSEDELGVSWNVKQLSQKFAQDSYVPRPKSPPIWVATTSKPTEEPSIGSVTLADSVTLEGSVTLADSVTLEGSVTQAKIFVKSADDESAGNSTITVADILNSIKMDRKVTPAYQESTSSDEDDVDEEMRETHAKDITDISEINLEIKLDVDINFENFTFQEEKRKDDALVGMAAVTFEDINVELVKNTDEHVYSNSSIVEDDKDVTAAIIIENEESRFHVDEAEKHIVTKIKFEPSKIDDDVDADLENIKINLAESIESLKQFYLSDSVSRDADTDVQIQLASPVELLAEFDADNRIHGFGDEETEKIQLPVSHTTGIAIEVVGMSENEIQRRNDDPKQISNDIKLHDESMHAEIDIEIPSIDISSSSITFVTEETLTPKFLTDESISKQYLDERDAHENPMLTDIDLHVISDPVTEKSQHSDSEAIQETVIPVEELTDIAMSYYTEIDSILTNEARSPTESGTEIFKDKTKPSSSESESDDDTNKRCFDGKTKRHSSDSCSSEDEAKKMEALSIKTEPTVQVELAKTESNEPVNSGETEFDEAENEPVVNASDEDEAKKINIRIEVEPDVIADCDSSCSSKQLQDKIKQIISNETELTVQVELDKTESNEPVNSGETEFDETEKIEKIFLPPENEPVANASDEDEVKKINIHIEVEPDVIAECKHNSTSEGESDDDSHRRSSHDKTKRDSSDSSEDEDEKKQISIEMEPTVQVELVRTESYEPVKSNETEFCEVEKIEILLPSENEVVVNKLKHDSTENESDEDDAKKMNIRIEVEPAIIAKCKDSSTSESESDDDESKTRVIPSEFTAGNLVDGNRTGDAVLNDPAVVTDIIDEALNMDLDFPSLIERTAEKVDPSSSDSDSDVEMKALEIDALSLVLDFPIRKFKRESSNIEPEELVIQNQRMAVKLDDCGSLFSFFSSDVGEKVPVKLPSPEPTVEITIKESSGSGSEDETKKIKTELISAGDLLLGIDTKPTKHSSSDSDSDDELKSKEIHVPTPTKEFPEIPNDVKMEEDILVVLEIEPVNIESIGPAEPELISKKIESGDVSDAQKSSIPIIQDLIIVPEESSSESESKDDSKEIQVPSEPTTENAIMKSERSSSSSESEGEDGHKKQIELSAQTNFDLGDVGDFHHSIDTILTQHESGENKFEIPTRSTSDILIKLDQSSSESDSEDESKDSHHPTVGTTIDEVLSTNPIVEIVIEKTKRSSSESSSEGEIKPDLISLDVATKLHSEGKCEHENKDSHKPSDEITVDDVSENSVVEIVIEKANLSSSESCSEDEIKETKSDHSSNESDSEDGKQMKNHIPSPPLEVPVIVNDAKVELETHVAVESETMPNKSEDHELISQEIEYSEVTDLTESPFPIIQNVTAAPEQSSSESDSEDEIKESHNPTAEIDVGEIVAVEPLVEIVTELAQQSSSENDSEDERKEKKPNLMLDITTKQSDQTSSDSEDENKDSHGPTAEIRMDDVLSAEIVIEKAEQGSEYELQEIEPNLPSLSDITENRFNHSSSSSDSEDENKQLNSPTVEISMDKVVLAEPLVEVFIEEAKLSSSESDSEDEIKHTKPDQMSISAKQPDDSLSDSEDENKDSHEPIVDMKINEVTSTDPTVEIVTEKAKYSSSESDSEDETKGTKPNQTSLIDLTLDVTTKGSDHSSSDSEDENKDSHKPSVEMKIDAVASADAPIEIVTEKAPLSSSESDFDDEIEGTKPDPITLNDLSLDVNTGRLEEKTKESHIQTLKEEDTEIIFETFSQSSLSDSDSDDETKQHQTLPSEAVPEMSDQFGSDREDARTTKPNEFIVDTAVPDVSSSAEPKIEIDIDILNVSDSHSENDKENLEVALAAVEILTKEPERSSSISEDEYLTPPDTIAEKVLTTGEQYVYISEKDDAEDKTDRTEIQVSSELVSGSDSALETDRETSDDNKTKIEIDELNVEIKDDAARKAELRVSISTEPSEQIMITTEHSLIFGHNSDDENNKQILEVINEIYEIKPTIEIIAENLEHDYKEITPLDGINVNTSEPETLVNIASDSSSDSESSDDTKKHPSPVNACETGTESEVQASSGAGEFGDFLELLEEVFTTVKSKSRMSDSESDGDTKKNDVRIPTQIDAFVDIISSISKNEPKTDDVVVPREPDTFIKREQSSSDVEKHDSTSSSESDEEEINTPNIIEKVDTMKSSSESDSGDETRVSEAAALPERTPGGCELDSDVIPADILGETEPEKSELETSAADEIVVEIVEETLESLTESDSGSDNHIFRKPTIEVAKGSSSSESEDERIEQQELHRNSKLDDVEVQITTEIYSGGGSSSSESEAEKKRSPIQSNDIEIVTERYESGTTEESGNDQRSQVFVKKTEIRSGKFAESQFFTEENEFSLENGVHLAQSTSFQNMSFQNISFNSSKEGESITKRTMLKKKRRRQQFDKKSSSSESSDNEVGIQELETHSEMRQQMRKSITRQVNQSKTVTTKRTVQITRGQNSTVSETFDDVKQIVQNPDLEDTTC